MKKLLIFIAVISISFTGLAQSNKSKTRTDNSQSQANKSQKTKATKTDNKENGVPAKVRAAFNRDHPNITDVTWSKGNGYWTATFANGIMRTSATYSANGQRINGPTSRNTRTSSNSDEGRIWDKILSKQ